MHPRRCCGSERVRRRRRRRSPVRSDTHTHSDTPPISEPGHRVGFRAFQSGNQARFLSDGCGPTVNRDSQSSCARGLGCRHHDFLVCAWRNDSRARHQRRCLFCHGSLGRGNHDRNSSPVVLTESSNASLHYLVLNRPVAALPASGTLACDSGEFTTPSSDGSVSVGAADFLGSSTGTASLTFGGGGATLAATIQIHNTNSSGTGNFSVQLSDPAVISFSGQSLGIGATGAFLGLGDVGDGSYLIGGSYTVKLASGAGYIGVFKFRCK